MSKKDSPSKYTNLSKPKLWAGFIALICLLVGLVIGRSMLSKSSDRSHHTDSCVSSLTLIKPTIDCDVTEKKSEVLKDLQTRLEVSVNGYINTGKATKIGIFVRDLNSTRFAGVNPNEQFIMASLLKLPLAIAGYKLAEVEPKILQQTITYTGNPDLYGEQNVAVIDKLKIGKAYTIKDLIDRSIIYSDNTAAQLLNNFYAPGYFPLILDAIGINPKANQENNERFIGPRDYANLFRNLYNSSYLTANYSNTILDILTKTNYRNGATKNIPSHVKVAHKFGERTVLDARGNPAFKQLHECGLVYAKDGNEPYTFCIMTEGTNFTQLETIEQELGAEIYNSMSQ